MDTILGLLQVGETLLKAVENKDAEIAALKAEVARLQAERAAPFEVDWQTAPPWANFAAPRLWSGIDGAYWMWDCFAEMPRYSEDYFHWTWQSGTHGFLESKPKVYVHDLINPRGLLRRRPAAEGAA